MALIRAEIDQRRQAARRQRRDERRPQRLVVSGVGRPGAALIADQHLVALANGHDDQSEKCRGDQHIGAGKHRDDAEPGGKAQQDELVEALGDIVRHGREGESEQPPQELARCERTAKMKA
jgi:hypothetical protein